MSRDHRTLPLGSLGPPRADVPSSRPADEPASSPSSRIQERRSSPSRPPFKPPIERVIDKLRQLFPGELAEVDRFIDKALAARGAAVDPNLVTLILSELLRLLPHYGGEHVPLARLRLEFPDVSRSNLDEALLEAERRKLLALRPAGLLPQYIEPSAGVPSSRGLLYFAAPLPR